MAIDLPIQANYQTSEKVFEVEINDGYFFTSKAGIRREVGAEPRVTACRVTRFLPNPCEGHIGKSTCEFTLENSDSELDDIYYGGTWEGAKLEVYLKIYVDDVYYGGSIIFTGTINKIEWTHDALRIGAEDYLGKYLEGNFNYEPKLDPDRYFTSYYSWAGMDINEAGKSVPILFSPQTRDIPIIQVNRHFRLVSGISSGATTFYIKGGATGATPRAYDLKIGHYLMIEAEIILITGKPGNDRITVARAQLGTNAAAYDEDTLITVIGSDALASDAWVNFVVSANDQLAAFIAKFNNGYEILGITYIGDGEYNYEDYGWNIACNQIRQDYHLDYNLNQDSVILPGRQLIRVNNIRSYEYWQCYSQWIMVTLLRDYIDTLNQMDYVTTYPFEVEIRSALYVNSDVSKLDAMNKLLRTHFGRLFCDENGILQDRPFQTELSRKPPIVDSFLFSQPDIWSDDSIVKNQIALKYNEYDGDLFKEKEWIATAAGNAKYGDEVIETASNWKEERVYHLTDDIASNHASLRSQPMWKIKLTGRIGLAEYMPGDWFRVLLTRPGAAVNNREWNVEQQIIELSQSGVSVTLIANDLKDRTWIGI